MSMLRSNRYAVLPFMRANDGSLVAGEVQLATSAQHAVSKAYNRVGKYSGGHRILGAIAFSRSTTLQTGHFRGVLVLARYGETPENFEWIT